MGGNSVGKTSNAALVHDFFKRNLGGERKVYEWIDQGKKCSFTKMNLASSNLGVFGRTACGGTDTLNSKFQIQKSFEKALSVSDVVIIEGIMATGTWIEFIKRPGVYLWLVLLDVSEENNFQRLKQRRSVKRNVSPEEIIISAKTQENLAGKLRGFRSLFERMRPYADKATFLDTNSLNQEQVGGKVREELISIISNTTF